MTDPNLERYMTFLMMMEKRMARACARLGLTTHPTIYQLVTDPQMVQLIPYVMMPSDYRHWSKGKAAEKDKENSKYMHIFEAVLNMSPSICYLGTTNTPEMQLNVIAHAVQGGHVNFFKNNKLFAETSPETVAARFAQGKRTIDKLIEDQDWGWEGVEYILDACHALESYAGWLPTVEDQVAEQELRDSLMKEARQLRSDIVHEGPLSASKKATLERQLALVENQLLRFPIRPTSDLLGALMSTENNPTLDEEARTIISIVRDRARYFQPQGRTKFMNEGWASYWEKHVLLQPEVDVPFEYKVGLIQAWTMHDRVATNWYFDPYALGLRVWEYIDEKYCFDEKEPIQIKVPLLKKEDDGYFTESKRTKTVDYTPRNRDKMFEVMRNYDDNRFLSEFMQEELFEKTNLDALAWARRTMELINGILRKGSWGPQLVFDPIPLTIDEMMEIIQVWMQAAQMTEQYAQQMGTPMFPIPAETLQNLGTVLQIVAAFDADKHKARRSLVLRTGYNSLPNIKLVDTGRFTDGYWTLKHEWDPDFGPLLQSECRDTLKFFRRLCNANVRLLTWEIQTDRRGNPVGPPLPYEYYMEDDDTVKERFLGQ